MFDISKIIQQQLDKSQYFPTETTKNQIYIHHTAGGGSAKASLGWWMQNEERVGTAFIIHGYTQDKKGNGDIYQAFASKYWAHHLYINAKGNAIDKKYKTVAHNEILNKGSIGIEVCNYGFLTKTSKGFQTYVKSIVPDDQVVELTTPYRGYKYWHKYSDEQIENLHDLLDYLCTKFNIPRNVDESIFDINTDALMGKSGIYSHTSVRTDKTDMSPQPNLINMLKNL